jgi:NAD(P)-dependent dehydrogenase (short-subunit alcohol dehydrogenase family)
MKIQGKVFVVTGGASGLGAATARHLIEQGAKVILVDMNQALGEELQRELGENAQFKSLDVTDEHAVQSFFQEVEAEYGTIEWFGELCGCSAFSQSVGS